MFAIRCCASSLTRILNIFFNSSMRIVKRNKNISLRLHRENFGTTLNYPVRKESWQFAVSPVSSNKLLGTLQ